MRLERARVSKSEIQSGSSKSLSCVNLGFFIDIGFASLTTFVLYLHCTAIYKGAHLRRFSRSIVILTMTSFARGADSVYFFSDY